MNTTLCLNTTLRRFLVGAALVAALIASAALSAEAAPANTALSTSTSGLVALR